MGFWDKIKNFGSRVWQGIRKGAGWVKDKAVSVGRKIIEIAKPVATIVGNLVPGKVGAIAKGVSAALPLADKVIDAIEGSAGHIAGGRPVQGVVEAVGGIANAKLSQDAKKQMQKEQRAERDKGNYKLKEKPVDAINRIKKEKMKDMNPIVRGAVVIRDAMARPDPNNIVNPNAKIQTLSGLG